MIKVLIEIKNGCVQEIYSNKENMEVIVVDLNIKEETNELFIDNYVELEDNNFDNILQKHELENKKRIDEILGI